MPSDPSSEELPTLFQRLALRDREAFGELWRRIRGKLRAFARFRVRREPDLRPIYDEEDAIDSGARIIWLKLIAGDLVPLDGLDDFLRLARTIVAGRIRNKVRELGARKRHVPENGDDDGIFRVQATYVPDDLDLLACDLPPPEASLMFNDQYSWLIGLLDRDLQQVAELRLVGKTIDQIAEKQGKSRRTIERMFQEIRAIWGAALRDP